jgi:hypothetical protein
MANSQLWSAPINLTTGMAGYTDHRYPSAAIYTASVSDDWTNTNTIFVTWQAMYTGVIPNRYDVVYRALLISNPPAVQVPWTFAVNLSFSTNDSLVPAIAINQYSPDPTNQHIHIVWQEEDTITAGGSPGGTEDGDFSDIAYIRSTDGGNTWTGPNLNWPPHSWDNLTTSGANSQMPSISCMQDKWSGGDPDFVADDFSCNSQSVHVSYNQDMTLGGIHVFYLLSTDDGGTWNAPVDITAESGGSASTTDAYSSIVVDMVDHPHIVYMRDNITQREPMRTGGNQYLAGLDPTLWNSFPGSEVGMYGASTNSIVYIQDTGSFWAFYSWSDDDDEFPTISMDRRQHINVNHQTYVLSDSDYEIHRRNRVNTNAPSDPVMAPYYPGVLVGPDNDSSDSADDDLFPNLVFNKASQYLTASESTTEAYDEAWTKVVGHGQAAAVAAATKEIWQDGNVTADSEIIPTDIDLWLLY